MRRGSGSVRWTWPSRAATGSFYRLDPDLTVTRAFGGIICSNGPAWSPDGATIYHVDSTRRLIRAYDSDVRDRRRSAPGRVFVSDEDDEWFPDGVTVDAEGFVWNCKWAGGRHRPLRPGRNGRPGVAGAGAPADPVCLHRSGPGHAGGHPAGIGRRPLAAVRPGPAADPGVRGLPTALFGG